MELDLSPEQVLLRDSTGRYIANTCPLTAVRAYATADSPYPFGYLRRAAELGWFAMLVPDELGGGSVSEDGLVDAAMLAEIRGAHVQPGSFVSMNVVAFALARNGSERHRKEVLPAIMTGEHVAVWALADPDLLWPTYGGVRGVATANGYRLDGVKEFVQDPDSADSFLVDAVIAGVPRQLLLNADALGVAVHPLESLDLSMRMGRLELDGVVVTEGDFVGTAKSARRDMDEQLAVAAVLCVAETVGVMCRLFDMTVQYARDRIAFGRPIGSFQAVKHQLADLSLLLEMSKAISEVATRTVAHDLRGGHTARRGDSLASAAKAFVGDASNEISQGCFQVFGGIGFTWEHDLHLYLRRASVNQVLYGTPTWHRERIVRLGRP
ncbi:acyl-CoA dehydrogenase family protein [Mycolicibacterium moriokaense]|uniref:Alkylation response protein AidB-like acyl-CoA dehydrogenase n=1 Tax=Mycolicibacterium moriokaense TaxID=39691 RepID=A0A318H868_9MYCO|nr:acyl-CoA dehydrogenase family protein [Mycolicibacterium moriokaense]PXX01645.1 alkylation response protein AidB-like acyl-CoA dehydrogenase [Mycolicibacterium moriokaense]